MQNFVRLVFFMHANVLDAQFSSSKSEYSRFAALFLDDRIDLGESRAFDQVLELTFPMVVSMRPFSLLLLQPDSNLVFLCC